MDITKCRFCQKGPLDDNAVALSSSSSLTAPLDENAVALSSSSSLTALLEYIYGVKITSHQSACRNCVLIARIMDNKLKKLRMMASPGHEGGAASSQSSPMEPVEESMATAFVSMFTREKGEEEDEDEDWCQRMQNLCSTPVTPVNPASVAVSDNSVTPGLPALSREALFSGDSPSPGDTSPGDSSPGDASRGDSRPPGDPSRGDSPSPGQFLSVAGRLQTVSSVDVPAWMTELSDSDLCLELEKLEEKPGPVNSITTEAYQMYLAKLHAGVQPSGNRGYKGYKYELALVLNGTVAIPNWDCVEKRVFQTFRQPTTCLTPALLKKSSRCVTPKQSKRNHTKAHFTYLLLDPVVLDDELNPVSSDLEQFRLFVESVFYVGKGKDARSFYHLKEAKNPPAKVSDKLKKILGIWLQGRGVIPLHIFQHTTDHEACTREACLIETIGLGVLTNVNHGCVYGEVDEWNTNKKREFGVHLLHKAFWSFKADRRQEIFKSDF